MNRIELHDAFVGQGCSDRPQPAVSLGAGVVWLHAYDAVSKAGRYVQGGGCTTVGVAGLIQSGGFGTFSTRPMNTPARALAKMRAMVEAARILRG